MSVSRITVEYTEPIYSHFNTSRGDLPAVVGVNAALREFKHRDLFPWHLSVLITPQALAEQGMPTGEECLVLDAVDDEIEAVVTGDRNAFFLARETWNGRRQLLFRVHDPEVADRFLQQLISRGSQQREWEFLMEYDAYWSFAAPYLSLFTSARGTGA
jgi:hypothetical protein